MLKKTIALEGIEIVAPIGLYEEERKNRNTFIIDISVEEPFDENMDPDEIQNTINYEKIFHIVKEEMEKECRLMEDVAQRILKRVSGLNADIQKIGIIIRKKDPPLKGSIKYSKVELHWSK